MTTFKDYPSWPVASLKDADELLRLIANIRKDDITEINNLQNIFVGGRKVGKIPTSSADVADTDRVGDVNYDASYLYILINNAGTPAWRRFSGGAW